MGSNQREEVWFCSDTSVPVFLGADSRCSLCPAGWRWWRNHCYFFSVQREENLNWNESAEFCRRHGSSLLVIKDSAEMVTNLIQIKLLLPQGLNYLLAAESSTSLSNVGFSSKRDEGIHPFSFPVGGTDGPPGGGTVAVVGRDGCPTLLTVSPENTPVI